jgi:hypothetical protein
MSFQSLSGQSPSSRHMARFSVLAVLSLLSSVAAAKGKGGSGSDGSPSGSDGSSGSSSGGGGSSPEGRQHVEISGAKWPYRFAGSYFSGSISLDTTIEYWPDCTEGKRGQWREDFDGTLLLGPGNWTNSFDDIDPNFLLMGWEKGTTPTSNWTDGEYWGNGGPGLTRWFSSDVKIMLSRYIEIWHDAASFDTTFGSVWDHGWLIDADPAGNGTNEYLINGTWSGVSLALFCIITKDSADYRRRPSLSSPATTPHATSSTPRRPFATTPPR